MARRPRLACLVSFEVWATCHTAVSPEVIDALKLTTAFEILVCRCADARRAGSAAPLTTVAPRLAGGNSRMATRRMLARAGYTPGQLRVIHRLMGGSTGGWPGLLWLYAQGTPVSAAQRGYVRRQVRLYESLSAQRHIDQVTGDGRSSVAG